MNVFPPGQQDPDIIMVGEIRDGETATMALQAALTGHLVLSTLHTNDAPSAVERLLDMGCKRYLVASALRAVLARRLVRLVCPDCREAYTPTPAELQSLGIDPGSGFTCFQGRGCVVCHGTGYRGRTGIFELLRIDSKLQRLISGGADTLDRFNFPAGKPLPEGRTVHGSTRVMPSTFSKSLS